MNRALIKSISFDKGPLILVQFLISENKVQNISLKLHSHFEAQFMGEDFPQLIQDLINWLKAYSEKKHLYFLPFDFNSLSDFRKNVYNTLAKVDFGKTCSYQQLAEKALSQKAFRAVGTACKTNPYPLMIPCHRVILSNKKIGCFNGGVEIKKRLLDFEEAAWM